MWFLENNTKIGHLCVPFQNGKDYRLDQSGRGLVVKQLIIKYFTATCFGEYVIVIKLLIIHQKCCNAV